MSSIISQQSYIQIFWIFAELIFALTFAAIVVGIFIGLFTYGRPRRKIKSDGIMEDIVEAVVGLTHALIDRVRRRSHGGDWLSDQQILSSLRKMKPSEFEEYIACMFERLGYQTRLVGGSGDGGIDIEMSKNGREYLVQCKKFITTKATPHDVRDFYGAIGDRHINGKGFFITTNIFTFEAERFAEGKQMELVDGNRLIGFIRESGAMPSNSFTASSTSATRCPLCGGRLVERTNRESGTRFIGCSNYPKCRFTKAI